MSSDFNKDLLLSSGSHSAATILRQIFSHYAKKPLIIDANSSKQYSYQEIEELSSRFAHYLSNTLSLAPGTKIALVLDNRIETIVTYLACIQAGIVSIPINPDFKIYELSSIFESCKAALFITLPEFADKVQQAAEPTDKKVIILDLLSNLSTTKTNPRISPEAFPNMLDSDLVHIMYSSGTTAIPKAIPICFGRIIRHAQMFANYHAINSTAVFINTLPLAYLGGWYNLGLVPMLAGSSIVLDKVFGPKNMYAFWERTKQFSVNSIWLTPSILSVLLTIGIDEDETRQYVEKNIKWAMVGMAPLNPALKIQFEEHFKLRLLQSYGLSETFLFTSSRREENTPHDSVGKILPGYKVSIANSEHGDISKTGEICVSSPYIFDGYFEQTEMTAACLYAGTLQTGDLGRFDQDGNLYIVGRIKDLIIKAGLNISPMEIEAIIAGMDGILEVGVFGVPHPINGEQIIAAIVKSSALDTISTRSVKEYCRKYLSPAKVPDSVVFVDQLPKTPSGKLLRRELKQLLNSAPNK